MALGDSAIADLKGPPPGAPSGALGEGTPGWVWRCDAAASAHGHMTAAPSGAGRTGACSAHATSRCGLWGCAVICGDVMMELSC